MDYSFLASKAGYLNKDAQFSTKGIARDPDNPEQRFELEIVLEKIFIDKEIVLENIYYDFDRYDIKEEYVPIIEAHANFLLTHPELKIKVEGNCDDRGSREYNLALGQRRAESVKRAMTLLGVEEDRIETVSFGAERPVAFGQDEASWAQNRRSDIVYVDQPG